MRQHPSLAAVYCDAPGCESVMSYERAARHSYDGTKFPRGWRETKTGGIYCPAHNHRPASRRKAQQPAEVMR